MAQQVLESKHGDISDDEAPSQTLSEARYASGRTKGGRGKKSPNPIQKLISAKSNGELSMRVLNKEEMNRNAKQRWTESTRKVVDQNKSKMRHFTNSSSRTTSSHETQANGGTSVAYGATPNNDQT